MLHADSCELCQGLARDSVSRRDARERFDARSVPASRRASAAESMCSDAAPALTGSSKTAR
jgi:hypothetical protein